MTNGLIGFPEIAAVLRHYPGLAVEGMAPQSGGFSGARLWKVHDAATAALMAKFYHELWVNKKPPIEALREAQLTIYRHPELIPDLAGERGAPKVKEALTTVPAKPQAAKRADTKLWAAFVLSGVGK